MAPRERGRSTSLAAGVITGEFLFLGGIGAFSGWSLFASTRGLILGMSNAQFAALLTAIAGSFC